MLEDDYRGPGYKCAHLAAVPAAMKLLVQQTEARTRRANTDALVTLTTNLSASWWASRRRE